MKICTRCKKEHSEETKWCAECKHYGKTLSKRLLEDPVRREKARLRCKRYRERDPEYHRERARLWRAANPNYKYANQKTKNRESHLRRNYGITQEQYQELYDAQGGKCAIRGCGGDAAHIDHNHNNGKIRELLCSRCNQALGLARESKEILSGMIVYIEKHSEDGTGLGAKGSAYDL